MKHFGSVKKIREASELQLHEAGMPPKLAEAIYQHFHNPSLKSN